MRLHHFGNLAFAWLIAGCETLDSGVLCPKGQSETLPSDQVTHFGKTGQEVAQSAYGTHSFPTRRGETDVDVTWNVSPIENAVATVEPKSTHCPSSVSMPVNVKVSTSDGSIIGSFAAEARLATRFQQMDSPKLPVLCEVPLEAFSAFPLATYPEKVRCNLNFGEDGPVGGSIGTVEDRDLSASGTQPTLRGRTVLIFGEHE
jgi:hypothetical protein